MELKKLFKINELSKEQKDIIRVLCNEYEAMFIRTISTKDKNAINYRNRYDDKKAFGYWKSSNEVELIEILRTLNIKSIFDIGCGPGLFLQNLYTIMASFMQNLIIGGIDKNEHCIRLAKRICIQNNESFEVLNMFDITTSLLKKWDCVYIWDPLTEKDEIKKFLFHLASVIPKNKYIIFSPYQMSWSLQSMITKKEIENITILEQPNIYSFIIFKS